MEFEELWRDAKKWVIKWAELSLSFSINCVLDRGKPVNNIEEVNIWTTEKTEYIFHLNLSNCYKQWNAKMLHQKKNVTDFNFVQPPNKKKAAHTHTYTIHTSQMGNEPKNISIIRVFFLFSSI